MMRYSQAEKVEIIRLVEASDLSVKQALQELDVPRSTFYRWYQCYQEGGSQTIINIILAVVAVWGAMLSTYHQICHHARL